MVSPSHAEYCVCRIVGLVKKLLMPTCEGAPSRNAANEFENCPNCDRAGPLAERVAPGLKNAAPLAPKRLLHIVSVKPSERMRRMSTPHFTLCIELRQPQLHTQLKVLSTAFSGTNAGA